MGPLTGGATDGQEQPAPLVRSAGGAFWRRADDGLEVLVVHRPHYDDWSLPKGKVDAGESDEDAALREVQEEASVVARLGPELPSVHYIDHRGRPKVARYWAMTVIDGEAAADNEIDRVEWLGLEAAMERLSYAHDRPVLDRLAEIDRLGGLGSDNGSSEHPG